MNKLFRKLHLWLSIPVGLIVSIICLSGAALVFEREITVGLNPHLYKVTSQQESTPLVPSALVIRIQEQVSDTLQLSSLQLPSNPENTCLASFKNAGRKTLSVNPYTGEVNGWIEDNPFFQTMRKLHRWLMDAPPKKGDRTFGKEIVGISTLIMVVILISGLIVWIPRNRKVLRNRLRVSCTKGWRRFWYDSHVALGFYATVFLLIMALTGLTWSYGWYRTAAYSLFGGAPKAGATPHSPHHEGKGNKKDKKHTFDYAIWDNVLADLQTLYPSYTSIKLDNKSAQITISKEGSRRVSDTATFNSHNGVIKEITRSADLPKSQTMKGWFYAFHTGSWGGIWTKIVYFLSALIGGILPLSGYYLWLKKKRKK